MGKPMSSAMKKTIFVLLAWLVISGVAMAQGGGSPPSGQTVGGYANSLPDTDLSNQLVESIFGPVWSSILSSGDINMSATGSGGLIGKVSLVLNIAALALTGFLVVFTTITSALSTGYEGVSMGQRYSTLWVPIRIAVALIMLIPVAGGYSLAQAGVMLVGKAGAGVASEVYQQAFDYVVIQQNPAVPPSVSGVGEVGEALLKSQVCMDSINKAVGPGTVKEQTVGTRAGLNGWGFEYSSSTAIGPAGCGSYYVRAQRGVAEKVWDSVKGAFKNTIGSQSSTNKATELTAMMKAYHAEQISALDTLRSSIAPVAQAISDDGSPDPAVYHKALSDYRKTLTVAAVKMAQKRTKINENTANADGKVTQRGAMIKQAESQLKSIGWIGAGAMYWTIAKSNRKTQELLNEKPNTVGADQDRIRKVGSPDLVDASDAMDRASQFVRNNAIVSIYNNHNDLSAVSAFQNGTQGNDTIIAGILRKMRTMLFVNVNGQGSDVTFPQYVSDRLTANGSPIMNGQAVGHFIVGMGEGALLAYVAAKALATGGAKGLVGRWIPIWSSGAEATLGGLDAFGPALYSIVASLFILGLALAYGLPAIPFVLWLFAIVNWMILLVEAVFACIVWAPAHAIPEGEGFTGSHARAGYLLLLALFMTPALMLAGLFSAMVIMGAAGRLIGILFPLIINDGQIHSLVGILGFIASMTILVIVFLVVTDRVFSLIHFVRDKILRWISGSQENLGEDQDSNRTRVLMAGVMSRFEGGAGGAASEIKKKGDSPKLSAPGNGTSGYIGE